MNNDWSSLSMRERAEYIKDAVSRGLHTVDSIRNEYKDGGKKKRTALDIQAANKQVFLKSLELSLKGNSRYSSAGWRKYLTDLALLESGYLAGITNKIGAKGYFLLMPSNRASSWSSPTLLFEEMFKMTDSNIQYLKKNMTKADLAKALALGIDIYGLVAGAHLGGAKGALNALRGVKNSKDMNGTSVMKYMKLFSQSTPKLTEADYQSNYSTSDLNRNRIVMLPHVEPVDNTYVAPIEPRYSVNPTLLPQGEAEGIQTSLMSLIMLELESPKMLLVEEPEVKSSPLTYILKVSESSVPVIKTQIPNKVTTATDLYKKYYDVSSPTLLLLNLEEAIYRSSNNEFGNGGLKGNLYGGDNPNGQLMMTVGSIGYMPKIYAEKPDAIHVQRPDPPIFVEPDVSNTAALERQRRVYSNYDEALDNPLNPVQKVIYNGLRYLKDNVYEGIPSGVSNCTLTATQWVNPASPIKLASSIVNDPGKYNYSKISKEDALPGNLVIAKVPNLDSYHTMMLSGFADKDSTYTFDGKKYKVTKGEPLVTYSRGGHDNSFIRRNVPLSVYTSNSDGHTENLFYRYNSPNEVFLPNVVVTAKKGNKKVLGGNLFEIGGPEKKWKALDNIQYQAIPDTTFTRENTGVGSIEYFPAENSEGITYGNGYYKPHPNPGNDVILYNPNDNDGQDIRLDALHIMPKDATYDALNTLYRNAALDSDVSYDAKARYNEDAERYGKGNIDSYEQYFNNEADGLLRNMFIEGTPEYIESKRYYPNKSELRKWNIGLLPYIDAIQNYLVTGERPANILPEVTVIGKRKKKHGFGGNLYDGTSEDSQQMTRPNIFQRPDGSYFYSANDTEIDVTPMNTLGDSPAQWTYTDSSGKIYRPAQPLSTNYTLTESENTNPLVSAANNYFRELDWRAKNDPASIALQGKYTMPLVLSPILGKGAAVALTNPYVDAALTSGFGAHGLQKLANGEADWTTALEIAPLGRLAKPMVGMLAPKQAIFNSDYINTKWYQDLVKLYGLEETDAMVNLILTKRFLDKFFGGRTLALAAKEAKNFEKIKELHSKISGNPEEGKAVLGGSPAIGAEGTINRSSAVPHDLDYMAYINDASKNPNTTMLEAYDALRFTLDNIRLSPILQTLRDALGEDINVYKIPKLFRHNRNLYRKMHSMLYGDNNLYVSPLINYEPEVGLNKVILGKLDGVPVDFFLSETPIMEGSTSGMLDASTPLAWKNVFNTNRQRIGLPPRGKDIQDIEGFTSYSIENPLVTETNGQWSPFSFGDRMMEDGMPSIFPVETYPGSGEYIPSALSFDGSIMPIGSRVPKTIKTPQTTAENGSSIIRTVQDNGKIRLSLPSHSETNPRQFVLEPQGDNKFYVHMRTWDGDHVPANLTNEEKQQLFDALYNELPEGAEILFPKSGPGYYGTRGTVAGLQRLSRDPRFTPGTKGTLQYLDKDGKTIKTYEGTSFIKIPKK